MKDTWWTPPIRLQYVKSHMPYVAKTYQNSWVTKAAKDSKAVGRGVDTGAWRTLPSLMSTFDVWVCSGLYLKNKSLVHMFKSYQWQSYMWSWQECLDSSNTWTRNLIGTAHKMSKVKQWKQEGFHRWCRSSWKMQVCWNQKIKTNSDLT